LWSGGSESVGVSMRGIGLDGDLLTNYTETICKGAATVAELWVLNQATRTSTKPKDPLPITVHLAAGLEKIGLAM
jgi:hypothetical protein